MCGITGSINFKGLPADDTLLKKMAATMAHRGPDDSGFFRDGAVAFFIIKREREHSDKMLHASLAPFFIAVDDNFRVGVSGKGVPLFQLLAKFPEIIDFSIKDDMYCPVFIAHRLAPARKINDRETVKAESNSAVAKETGIVRTAVCHCGRHFF